MYDGYRVAYQCMYIVTALLCIALASALVSTVEQMLVAITQIAKLPLCIAGSVVQH
jgi:hypothetical protein